MSERRIGVLSPFALLRIPGGPFKAKTRRFTVVANPRQPLRLFLTLVACIDILRKWGNYSLEGCNE